MLDARTIPVSDSEAHPPFDATAIDQLDDEELDELELGVICLAADGLILRYNRTEGRLARLDPATVIGRNFFTDVAPCTYTEEFYGRFRTFVEGTAPSASFDYVFDFKFGAQRVEVGLVRVPGAERLYLLINRSEFSKARAEGSREPAPLQAELDPEASELGVRRDRLANRVIELPARAVEHLSKAVAELSEDPAGEATRAWGTRLGRRLSLELEAESLTDRGVALAERAMDEVVDIVSGRLSEAGWGLVRFDLGRSDTGLLRLEVARSALATRGDRRCCAALAGLLGAVVSHLAGRQLHVEEVSCSPDRCEMLVAGVSRRLALAELASRGLATDAIIDQLSGGEL